MYNTPYNTPLGLQQMKCVLFCTAAVQTDSVKRITFRCMPHSHLRLADVHKPE